MSKIIFFISLAFILYLLSYKIATKFSNNRKHAWIAILGFGIEAIAIYLMSKFQISDSIPQIVIEFHILSSIIFVLSILSVLISGLLCINHKAQVLLLHKQCLILFFICWFISTNSGLYLILK